MSWRRRLLTAGVVVALAGGGAAAIAPHLEERGHDPRSGSTLLPSTSPPVPITTVPAAYGITYRVEDGAGRQQSVTTERDAVRRPFDGRQEALAGPPPGRGAPLSTLITTLNRLSNVSSGGQPTQVSVPPGPAVGDLRFDAVLPDALASHLVTERERRLVLGRPCQVYRTATALGNGVVTAWHTDDPTYVDSCVDGSGLLLEEVVATNGRIQHRQVATAVVTNDAPADSLFEVSGTLLDMANGGGSVKTVEPGSRPPGTFWEVASPPAGFSHQGRYAVIPPQPEQFSDPSKQNDVLAEISDVYVRGADVLVVSQGGRLSGAPPFPPDANATKVDGGALGPGELSVQATASVEHFVLTGGHFVEVMGTLPPDQITAVARSLQSGPGGTLVLTPDAQPGAGAGG